MFRKRLSRLLSSALGNRNCLHQARHGRSPALNREHGRVQSLRAARAPSPKSAFGSTKKSERDPIF